MSEYGWASAGEDSSLNEILGGLRETLQKIEQAYESSRDVIRSIEQTHEAADQHSGQERQDAVLELLFTLASEATDFELAMNMIVLHCDIKHKDFDYEQYRTLIQCVVRRASDDEIWASVNELITNFPSRTPPKSSVSSNISRLFPDTPMKTSSASQQGSEHTEALLKDRTFEEIRCCTFRGVGGFDEKFFEGKKWTPRSQEIYQKIRSRHVQGHWIDFPNPPEEKKVFDWLNNFQLEFLSDARGTYVRTRMPSDLIGGEAPRQLDIFVTEKTTAKGQQFRYARNRGYLKCERAT